MPSTVFFFLLSLLLIGDHVRVAYGFEIIANQRTLVLDVTTNQLYSNSTVTFRCGPSDFGVPQSYTLTTPGNSSRTYNLTITCNSPTISYSYAVVEYVPRDGTLVHRKFCKMRDFSKYDPDGAFTPRANYTVDGTYSTSRSLNSLQGHASVSVEGDFPDQGYEPMPWDSRKDRDRKRARKNKWALADVETSAQNTRKLQGFFDNAGLIAAIGISTVPGLGGVGLAVCALTSCLGGGGDGCPGCKQALDKLQTDTETYKRALRNMSDNLITYTTTVTNLAELSEYREAQTREALNGIQNQVLLLQDKQDLSNTMQARINTMVQKQMENTIASQASQAATLTNVASTLVAAIAAQNDSNTQVLVQMNELVTYMNATTKELANSLSQTRSWFAARLRDVTLNFRTILAAVKNMDSRTDEKRVLTRMIQLAIGNLTAEGIYTPFLLDFGQAPALYLGQYASVLIDVLRTRYIKSVLGSPVAVQIDWIIKCDTLRMVGMPFAFLSFRDIGEMTGKPGCDATIPGDCACLWSYTMTTCPVNGSLQFSSAWTSGSILNTSTMCTSAPTVTGPTIYDDITTILDLMGTRCDDGVFNSTLIYLGTQNGGVQAVIPYNATVCTMDLDMIFNYPSYNWVHQFFDMLTISYGTAFTTLDLYYGIIDGIIPTNLTFTEEPFTRCGSPAQDCHCTHAAFMAYSEDYLPVYKLFDPQVQVSITSTLDGVPFTDNGVILNIPEEFLESSYSVIGEPLGNPVYDVPLTDISLSPFSSSREGKVTYAGCSVGSNDTVCTITAWSTKFGRDLFNAFQGDNVASVYSRPYNATSRLCTGTAPVYAGSWCDTLRYNYITQHVGNSTFAFEPKTAYAVGIIHVPDGVLVANQFSQCPTVTVEPTSGVLTTVILSNPAALAIRVAIVELGSCARSFADISVGAGSSYRHLVPACQVTNARTNLTVFRYVGFDLEECPEASGLDVATDRAAVLATQQIADTRYVNTQSTNQIDTVAIGVNDLIGRMTRLLLDISVFIPTILIESGAPPVGGHQNNLTAIIQEAAAIATAANLNLIDTRNRSGLNSTEITATYNTQIYAINNQTQAYANASLTAIANLYATAQNGSDLFRLLNLTTIALIDSINAAYNASATLADTQLQVAQLTVAAILNFQQPVGLSFLRGIRDVFNDALNGAIDLGEDVFDLVKDIAKAAVELGKSGLDSIFDMLKLPLLIIVGVITFIILIALGCGAVYVYRAYFKESPETKLARMEVEHARTVEGLHATKTPLATSTSAETAQLLPSAGMTTEGGFGWEDSPPPTPRREKLVKRR